MSCDEAWNNIKQLCPVADFKPGDGVGEVYVDLPSILYAGAGNMYQVTAPRGGSHSEAAEKTWARLMQLNDSEQLYRDLGPAKSLSGRRYELVHWDGTNWIATGVDD